MEKKFESLDGQKRDRILNAAFEVFSKNSFQKASTNEIVALADISKGILFHYFKSKQALYDYLKHFAFKTLIDAIEEELDWSETDFFQRLKAIGIIKTRILVKYPYMTNFIQVLHEQMSIEDMMALIQQYNGHIMQDVYMRNIDYSKFKTGIDLQRVITMTQWTFEKLGETWFKSQNPADLWDFGKLQSEADAYIALLRATFYKEMESAHQEEDKL